jgi:uncharacterized iron-regulated protein
MKPLRIGFAVAPAFVTFAFAAFAAFAFAAFGCAAPMTLTPAHGFVQPLGKAHPLTGRVYRAASSDFVSVSELNDAIEASEFLVLGETHDNRDHHRLEAKLVEEFANAHPTAAAGFEMLDEDIRAAVQSPPRDPDAFARAVQWDKSGWPEFAQYRPVFEVVLSRSMPVIAAHPSREKVRASMAAIPSDEIHALHLDVPLPEVARDQLRDEIRESHCGHAPAAMLDMMERAQSYKDAFMARSIHEARRPVVLVTGAGHARNDRAVPRFLRLLGATRITSVAFLEVDDARTTPDRYDVAAFDFVVFTPRVSDEDPCARFEEELKKMRQQEPPPASAPDVSAPGETPADSPHPSSES